MKLKIFPFKKVKSTNSTAIRLINQNINFGVVTSERQYKGRGQGTNRWISRNNTPESPNSPYYKLSPHITTNIKPLN